ncbi:hypothetical protein [Variovorax boronicumulans]|uniref:hypothetical protein n=1 Tax=Variovorax boronicumulans TaxID=436515 RepID=UPI00339A74DF
MGQPSITIYVDNVGTPHTFLGLNDGNGGVQYFGFAPSSAGSPHGPGNVGSGLATHAQGDPKNERAGYIDDVGWSKTVPITGVQYEAMKNAVAEWDRTGHTYDGIAKFGGENCTTFVQFVARAGNLTEINTSRTALPINLIPADERRGLFTTDADGRRSPADALKDPLHTPGTPAYEFKQSHPELFQPATPGDQGTKDQSTSQLRENPDGSFTEIVTQTEGSSSGDSQTTEYSSTGEVIQTTEIDGAQDNADYSTRFTAFDKQGQPDFTDFYRDDGTRDRSDNDQGGSQDWVHADSHYDAQGREDWRSVTMDDGSKVWTDFDQNNERGDRIWENRVDARGREDWRSVTMDDGSKVWTDFDQNNERGDRIWENRVDARGREDWASVTMDNGTRNWTDYDQDSSQGWSRVESLFDAQGREDNANMFMDDGRRNWFDYDQDGSKNWTRVESHFDAQGREDNANMFMDDGSRNWFDYDQDGSQVWTRVESHFDAQGREDYAKVYHDNGIRTEINYDQDNTQSWEKMVTTFTAWGQEYETDVIYDPGVVDHGAPPPLTPFPSSGPGYAPMPPGTACVSALGGTSCEPRYDVDYGWF